MRLVNGSTAMEWVCCMGSSREAHREVLWSLGAGARNRVTPGEAGVSRINAEKIGGP
jgi:hypothetical protein